MREQCHEGEQRNHQYEYPKLVARNNAADLAQVFVISHQSSRFKSKRAYTWGSEEPNTE
jgi:hypothetical protein